MKVVQVADELRGWRTELDKIGKGLNNVYIVQCTIYIVQCIVQCTICIVQCIVQCTIYIVQCIVQCTMYIMQLTEWPCSLCHLCTFALIKQNK